MTLDATVSNYFEGAYVDWRKKRIDKIKRVLGPDCLKDKTVLELGCAHGHTGKILREEFGADVTFAEGRAEYEPYIRNNNPDSEIIILDQDKKWALIRKFDAIIHWGVLYHLDNWQQDLECACNHTDLLFLESEVIKNNNDPNGEIKFHDHDGFDQALNGAATRPAAANIEKELTKNNFNFVCYDDDPEMNSPPHYYHWKHGAGPTHGYRRYWIARRNHNVA